MKKIIFFMIFIIAFSAKSNCGLTGSINYSHNPVDDYFLASIDLRRAVDSQSYGVYDEFKVVNLMSGIRLQNEEVNYVYNFSILSYLALFKIPLKPIFNTQEYPNMDDHDLNDGPAYLTFSFKGPELSNIGIYKKDYNWSSIGIDFLYKNFEANDFYTRLSYIVTASTIQNNMDYFTDMNVVDTTTLSLDMKIENSTNLLLNTRHRMSELKFKTYYRMIFNDSQQKEVGINLQYNYLPSWDLVINSQIGYIRYGAMGNWKNLFRFGLGISYQFIR
jgi:hypothetical protein